VRLQSECTDSWFRDDTHRRRLWRPLHLQISTRLETQDSHCHHTTSLQSLSWQVGEWWLWWLLGTPKLPRSGIKRKGVSLAANKKHTQVATFSLQPHPCVISEHTVKDRSFRSMVFVTRYQLRMNFEWIPHLRPFLVVENLQTNRVRTSLIVKSTFRGNWGSLLPQTSLVCVPKVY